MANSMRYWTPNSVEPNLMPLMAVQMSRKQRMTQQLHRQLMLDKLTALFEAAGEKDAARALEMSAEQFPELMSIRQQRMPQEWPQALMDSDLMSEQMRKINWSRETIVTQASQQEIKEALEGLSLHSLLEML